MHFVVYWAAVPGKIIAPNTSNAFVEALKPYSWVRPLPNFYIVNVPTSDQYQNIVNALNFISQHQPVETVHLIIGPPMTGGTYSGFLPQSMWPQINERSI